MSRIYNAHLEFPFQGFDHDYIRYSRSKFLAPPTNLIACISSHTRTRTRPNPYPLDTGTGLEGYRYRVWLKPESPCKIQYIYIYNTSKRRAQNPPDSCFRHEGEVRRARRVFPSLPHRTKAYNVMRRGDTVLVTSLYGHSVCKIFI